MIEALRILDHKIFYAVNSLAGNNSFFDVVAIFLAGNIFLAIWVLALAGIWFKFKQLRVNVYVAFISALISRGMIVELMKRIFDRPRPYEALSNIHQLIADSEHGVSFPSGHTAIYFSFAFAFWGTRYFWPFFILAAIASLDRVFVGVHYPADILVGAIIGALTGLIILRVFKKRFLR